MINMPNDELELEIEKKFGMHGPLSSDINEAFRLIDKLGVVDIEVKNGDIKKVYVRVNDFMAGWGMGSTVAYAICMACLDMIDEVDEV